MKVLFVSWGEVPRMTGVYGSQLVDVARRVGATEAVQSVGLVAGVPIIHSGLFREKWRYGRQVKAIRRALGKGNFVTRHLAVPPVGIYPSRAQLRLFELGQLKSMVSVLQSMRPDILHCRSYLATYMAHEWQRLSGLPFRIVFDARSYMPDEAIKRGRWAENSPDHLFWRQKERWLLQSSDAVNVVSEPMRRRFTELGANPARTHLIPLNVEDSASLGDAGDMQMAGSGGPVFCYCGYLDYNTWHHPINIWRAFGAINAIMPESRLLVITKSPHAPLADDIAHKGFGHLLGKITFTSAATSSECVRIMRSCDAGLLGYFTPTTPLEFQMAESVFATKTAEYLVAGLPVLVNSVCGGAAEFVEANQVGVSYDETRSISAGHLSKLLHFSRQRDRIMTTAHSHFNTASNANKLVHIYRDILGTG